MAHRDHAGTRFPLGMIACEPGPYHSAEDMIDKAIMIDDTVAFYPPLDSPLQLLPRIGKLNGYLTRTDAAALFSLIQLLGLAHAG